MTKAGRDRERWETLVKNDYQNTSHRVEASVQGKGTNLALVLVLGEVLYELFEKALHRGEEALALRVGGGLKVDLGNGVASLVAQDDLAVEVLSVSMFVTMRSIPAACRRGR